MIVAGWREGTGPGGGAAGSAISGYNVSEAVLIAARQDRRVEVAMALPNPEQVKSWGGKLLVDPAGQPIGTVTQVYNDDATGLPEWATTRLGEATLFLPLQGAVEADGQIRVAVHRDDVAKSPAVLDKQHITPGEEARLYQHYGIPYTPARSRSGLPVGEGPVPSRVTVARRAAADAGRRFTADPPTVALTAVAVLLAGVLAVLLRRRRPGDRSLA
jgi:hypothetical protein